MKERKRERSSDHVFLSDQGIVKTQWHFWKLYG